MNEYFVKMNQRLDEGWKLTDTNCPFCSASVMISPSLKDFFCCKCNKSVEIEIEEEEVENKSSVLNNLKQEDKINKQEETFNEIDYKNLKKQQEIISNKTNQSSKKMSDKLLKGWTMLEDCCPDCFVPLMKKKNEIMCVGCDCSFPKENNKKNLNNEARVIIDKEVGNTCEDKIKEKNSKNLKFDNKEIESQNLKYQKFTFECYANLSESLNLAAKFEKETLKEAIKNNEKPNVREIIQNNMWSLMNTRLLLDKNYSQYCEKYL